MLGTLLSMEAERFIGHRFLIQEVSKKKKKTDANKTRCHCMVLRKKHDLCQQLLFLSR